MKNTPVKLSDLQDVQKTPLVEIVDVHKSFGVVIALKGDNFKVRQNEVVGLVGDNGAGKSTLIKILTGFIKPDKGKLYWKGREVKNYSVRKGREMGIETVHQDRALVEKQNVWRNLFMGRELTYGRTGFIRVSESRKIAEALLKDMVGLTQSGLNADLNVKGLSGGEKQGVAISRSLFFKAELMILDEPTNNLSLTETKKVLDFVKGIKKHGKSCIFITHNIYHVYPVADRFVILDRGKITGEYFKKDISLGELIRELEHLAKYGK